MKKFKTALFDCAINEKCCSVDGGQGICRLFSSPPRGIWQLKSPHPQEFAIQGQKNASTWGSAQERGGGGGGAECSWNWLMHYQSNINAPQKGTRILFYGHVPNSFPPLWGTNSTTTNCITGTANFNVNKDNFWTLCSQGLFASIVINLYQAPKRYRDNSGSSYFRF